MYRFENDEPFVLLVHPGGPFWRGKDRNSWSIAKGEFGEGETAEAAAIREFEEETGVRPQGTLVPLGEVIQPGGKKVIGFALAGNLNASEITSELFEIEWPKGSGRRTSFPEVDRAEWFTLGVARQKILKGQSIFLDRLEDMLQGKTKRCPARRGPP